MILDYNKCQKLMDSFNNTIITEVSPIGYTSNEKLPIRHFILGNGSKQVVSSDIYDEFKKQVESLDIKNNWDKYKIVKQVS